MWMKCVWVRHVLGVAVENSAAQRAMRVSELFWVVAVVFFNERKNKKKVQCDEEKCL